MASVAIEDSGFSLKYLPSANISSHIPRHEPSSELKPSTDEAVLAYFGKRQQLKRNFGLLSIIGLSCTILLTWEGLLTAFQAGLLNGGPLGLVYGFIFTWIGSFTQVLIWLRWVPCIGHHSILSRFSNFCHRIPLAGGQYNWVAILAPPRYSKFLSYLTGWITIIAWQAGLATGAFLGGTTIQGLLVQNYTSYNFQRWHGTLLYYAITAVALFFNTYLGRLLPKVEAIVLMVHVVGFFANLIPLVYFAPHGSPKSVFENFQNSGGWSTNGLSFFVGLTTSMLTFTGIDAAAHMAEEIENASSVIPRSMCISVLLNGSFGFGMLVAVLFCIGNVDNALATPTKFPFIEIFAQATGTKVGGTAMVSVVVVAFIFETVGLLATTSRMTWAFARERGLPGSAYLSRVEHRTFLPLWSIGLSTIVNLCLALINIGSTTAFNAFTWLTIAAFYSVFLIAAGCLLLKRLTVPTTSISWGPFRLGRLGIPINILSIIFSVIGIFFSLWPPTAEVTAQTMNWSVVVYGGFLIFGIVFWFLHGRKVYTGPIIEIHRDFPASK